MDWFQLVVLALATWRVSSLFVNEDGPFDMFFHLRMWSIRLWPWLKTESGVPNNFFAQLLSCVWCFSIYAGAFWVVFYLLSPRIAILTAIALDLSTITIVLNLLVEKLKTS